MIVLGIGVLLWAVVHLIPSVEQPLKLRLVGRFGEQGYRGVFSLAIVVSLVLIVLGWRSMPEEYVYVLPQWSRPAGLMLMIVSFVLLGAANYQTVIKRYIRHPMLMGVAFWSISHLLTNGTTRALILFGGLGLWAIIEMPLINRREGEYARPEAPTFARELRGLLISAVVFVIVLLLHPYFAGVIPLPR